MLSIVLYEITFPAADFEIEETNFNEINQSDLNTLKKMQTKMDKLTGKYDETIKSFHKINTLEKRFEHWKNKNALVFILRKKDDKTISGYAIVMKMMTPNRCHISELYIDDKYRSGGLGRHLLTQVEQMMKSKGYKTIQLNCSEKNEIGNKLYQSVGYNTQTRLYSKKL